MHEPASSSILKWGAVGGGGKGGFGDTPCGGVKALASTTDELELLQYNRP